MLLLSIWSEKYTLRYLPITLLQVIYCAGTSYILSAVQATSGPRLGRVALTSALSQAEQCIRYTLIAGKSYECANEVATILSNLLHEQLRPRLLMRTLEPKDILPPVPASVSSPERGEQAQQQQYPGMTNGASSSASSEAHSDAISLATTINNLDALRDQCRFQIAAHSQQPLDSWGFGPGPGGRNPLTLLPISQAPSSSTATSSPASQFGAYALDPTPTPGSSRTHNASQSQGQGQRMPEDIEMEYGLGGMGGMDLGMMAGQPLSNRPYMSFGIPELVGMPPSSTFPDIDAPPPPQPSYNARLQQQQQQGVQGPGMQLDFSADDLAVMDQLLRQQFGQGIGYGMPPPPQGSTRYDPL